MFLDDGDCKFDLAVVDRKFIQGMLYNFMGSFADVSDDHDSTKVKPFSTSPLIRSDDSGYWWNVNLADSTFENDMANYAINMKGGPLRCGPANLTIKEVEIDTSGVIKESPVRKVFIYDAIFKRVKGYNLYPSIQEIFDSVYRKSVKLGVDIPHYDKMVERVSVSNFSARTTYTKYDGMSFPALSGRFDFRCDSDDIEVLKAFNILIDIATFIGVGSYTTRGNGFVDAPKV